MTTKNFHKDLLRDLLFYGVEDGPYVLEESDEDWGNIGDSFQCIHDERLDDSRWSANHYRVFSHTDINTGLTRLYQTQYSVGLTEYQDERPYEWEDTFVKCEEVMRIVTTKTIEEVNFVVI